MQSGLNSTVVSHSVHEVEESALIQAHVSLSKGKGERRVGGVIDLFWLRLTV